MVVLFWTWHYGHERSYNSLCISIMNFFILITKLFFQLHLASVVCGVSWVLQVLVECFFFFHIIENLRFLPYFKAWLRANLIRNSLNLYYKNMIERKKMKLTTRKNCLVNLKFSWKNIYSSKTLCYLHFNLLSLRKNRKSCRLTTFQ
jgi:hypothetical protein